MKKKILLLNVCAVTVIASWCGCKSTPQFKNRPDFLSTYNHLQKVDATTMRYVSLPLLGECDKFIISPVKVLFNEYEGKPITADQRQRTADYVRQTIMSALGNRYGIVNEPGPKVGEIRVALTDAYRTGGKLGLCVEGEILDNSNTQVAAVAKTELSEHYAPRWEDKEAAKKMVNEWAQRLRKFIDEAHAK